MTFSDRDNFIVASVLMISSDTLKKIPRETRTAVLKFIRDNKYPDVSDHEWSEIAAGINEHKKHIMELLFKGFTKSVSNLYAVSSSIHGTGWTVTRNSLNMLIPPAQTTSNPMYYNMVSQGATYGLVQHSDLGLGNTIVTFNYIAN